MILGGAQLTVLDLCRFLDPTRFEATLLTGPELGPEGDLLSVAREAGIRTRIIPSLGREIRPVRDFQAYRGIRRHFEETRYDVVHTHISKTGILGRQAARQAGVPAVIHTAHGWQWTLARSAAMRRFIINCERWAARRADRIIVVAEGDREKGLSAGVGTPDQYVVIESAIALEAFDPDRVTGQRIRRELGIPAAAPVAGTVGRMAHPKEPAVMLQAARRILTEHVEAHFVYVGDGPDRSTVLAGLGEFRDHPRLHLPGLQRDVAPYMAAMDVFLLSSSSEGLPRTVVEAMALGKPVVSTPAGAVPDLVIEGETGHLVPFADAAGLAAATLSLLREPQRGRALGGAARGRVIERFDVLRMVRRIEALYLRVLSEKRRP